MNYTLRFGKMAAPAPRRKSTGSVFRLAVFGDFSGRANKGKLEIGSALAARKPAIVDVDNFEALVERMGTTLQLPLAEDGGMVLLQFESIDDFHPDQLYGNLDLFSELAALRQRLKNTSTFAAAAKELQSWGLEIEQGTRTRAPRKSRGTAIPKGKLNDFARLIGKTSAPSAEEASADDLIRQIVAPHIVQAASPDQPAMIAAVDEAISAAMRRILHHPDFQALESVWRSVELLIRELETGPDLQILLYDVSAEEIAADLSATDALHETGLYKLLVEQPQVDSRIGPPSVLVGNYQFELSQSHAELLGRIGKVAAAAQAPFVAAVSNECMDKIDPNDVDPWIVWMWDVLRVSPQANYLGLVAPRFMLRWPYGAKTEPIDSFKFEEFTPQAGLKGMLWANGSLLVGLLLAKTASEQGVSGMKLGSILTMGDVPFYYYTDADGDQVALPNTERLVTESVATRITSQNFMPVFSVRGRPEVRLGSFASLAGANLAGPWAPVEIAYGAEEQVTLVPPEMIEYAEEAESQEAAPEAAIEEAAAAEEVAPEEQATQESEKELDPELAALLAEL